MFHSGRLYPGLKIDDFKTLYIYIYIYIYISQSATSSKVAGSITDGVNGIFH